MKIAYIRWLDACYMDGEQVVSELDQRCELEHVGFIVKETDEAVTISTESIHDGRCRNPFSIRRSNIVEMRVRDHASVFRLDREKSKPSP